MNAITRQELFKRITKYNPNASKAKLIMYSTILESLINDGFKFAPANTESKWVLYPCVASKWSVELEQDLTNLHGINVDAEIVNMLITELKTAIPRNVTLAYLSFTRVNTDFACTMEVKYGGFDGE